MELWADEVDVGGFGCYGGVEVDALGRRGDWPMVEIVDRRMLAQVLRKMMLWYWRRYCYWHRSLLRRLESIHGGLT